ncbi:MAG: diguanylate cyclase [Burkholderiaceae bacterium]|nr:diguanylate cyclase [Burkholderiaceae bacterium]
MTALAPNSIEDRIYVLRTRWEFYVAEGRFEQFIEFAVAVNSLAEHLNRMRLPGLMRICEGLENAALARLGNEASHPLGEQDVSALQRQMDTLLGAVASAKPHVPDHERRTDEHAAVAVSDIDWIKPRSVWLVSALEQREMVDALCRQLRYFGFQVAEMSWGSQQPVDDMPLAVLFIPAQGETTPQDFEFITLVRSNCPASQLFYLGVQSAIEPIVALMRAGIDVAIPAEEQSAMVLDRILDLVQNFEQEKHRVLVVEDSRVAVALIQRTLAQHGIDSHAIRDPGTLFDVLESYRPDLVLMDMYMPRFNGVEATRVLRQMSAYSTLPIVYLSGASDVGMQVEALRLGGDQFLTKPFNPVLLAAVVKTKIERFRETLRSTRLDGLTGLLNHTAAKSRLNAMVGQVSEHGALTVVMIDIDHFKSVNVSYGHPVGDTVIRALAWLLKGRLRSSDLIGRYGGEEFLIALPGVSPEQARAVIDRIRCDFAALPHAHSGGALHATFSAGMASYPMLDTAAGLTEAADAALLQAKRLGRNRVEKAVLQ